MNIAWRFELVLAATLVLTGVMLLPFAIFWVGQFVVGEYEGDGLDSLIGTIWSELGQGRIAAWALVLSPYIVIQLIRLARASARRS